MSSQDLHIQWRDPRELRAAPSRAKAHPPEQVERIAASIRAFSFDQPIVVDEQGVIIKGHGRHAAALRLGLAQLPVLVRGNLTEKRKIAAGLADNKSAESHWLPLALAPLLDTLKQELNLLCTGFNHEEIQGLLQNRPLPTAAYKALDPGAKRRNLGQCPHCGARLAR